eukprot:Skav232222  [mRNA]  locus=scaffold286:114939:118511:- [translate_table: standard]
MFVQNGSVGLGVSWGSLPPAAQHGALGSRHLEAAVLRAGLVPSYRAWPLSGVALRFGHRARRSVEVLGCRVKELTHWFKFKILPFRASCGLDTMVSSALAVFLMIVPLRATFPSCGDDGIATNGNTTATVPVEVNVQGQSGKFTIVPQGSSGNSVGIRVTMDAIREVDAAGAAVGQSGSVKHSLNTFASQSFTVGNVEQVTINSVAAAKISFESTISSIGKLGVDTYLMADSGSVGMNNDTWSVGIGDLKWNIRLWDWTWCGDSGASCKNGEVGDAVELDITVQNMGGGSASKDGNKTVSLGGSAELQLSTEVQTDCVWKDMAEGYPMVTTQGSSTTITFRFPRFDSGSLYDPVISGSCSELGLDCTDGTTDVGRSSQRTAGAAMLAIAMGILI